MLILTSIAALGGLTVILALMLIIANKQLHVKEDPRIDIVDDICGIGEYIESVQESDVNLFI